MRNDEQKWKTMRNGEHHHHINHYRMAFRKYMVCTVELKPSSNQGQTRGLSHQFFVQLSAQNLSQILNVWVKVWTKHTQMRQKRIFVQLQFGQVTIRIIPSTPYFALFNHIKTVPTVRPIYFTRGGGIEIRAVFIEGTVLSHFKVTLLANDSDVWQMSVI